HFRPEMHQVTVSRHAQHQHPTLRRMFLLKERWPRKTQKVTKTINSFFVSFCASLWPISRPVHRHSRRWMTPGHTSAADKNRLLVNVIVSDQCAMPTSRSSVGMQVVNRLTFSKTNFVGWVVRSQISALVLFGTA
ncbi:MAG: hypothetical protein KDA69_22035, partial [Planctomycetaceae bacterium]|nr:hypothetical protein [Planctomycetaceae bacterium]